MTAARRFHCIERRSDLAGETDAVVRALLRTGREYLPVMIGLNVLDELSFNIPGLGLIMIQRLNQVDMPVVIAIISVYALFVVWWYFVCDCATMTLDRRARPA